MLGSTKLLQRFLEVEKPLYLGDFQEISYSVLSGKEKSVDASAVRGSQSSLREAVATVRSVLRSRRVARFPTSELRSMLPTPLVTGKKDAGYAP